MPKKSPPEGRNRISIHISDCLRKRGLCPFSAEPVQDVVKQLLDQEPCLKLVIDMGKTLFLDSSGCGGLISSLKTLKDNHGEMKIARPTSKVIEIFQLTRLHRVFEIHHSVESALESFA